MTVNHRVADSSPAVSAIPQPAARSSNERRPRCRSLSIDHSLAVPLFTALQLALDRLTDKCGYSLRPNKSLNSLAHFGSEPDFGFFDVQ